MEIKNNTVWIVKGNDCFTIFSSKAYAEEYRKSLIEIWKNSIIKDVIPSRLNNRKEIEKCAKDYQEVICVGEDHYDLIKGWSSHPQEGAKEYWYYELMSNADWKEYYERYTSEFVIEDYLIFK